MHKTELELALRYAKTPEEMRAAIASAIVEVDRLIQLAEDLLVLARSEEGKLALDLRRVGVAELLGDLRERFSARIDEAGRSLVIEPADGLTVEGDRLRLEQALTNLVENAIEHGGGEITVRAQRVGRRGGDPRRGPRPGIRPGLHRAGLRALQPRRSRPRRRGHRARPGDRRGDRPGAPGQRPRRRIATATARTSGSRSRRLVGGFHGRFIRLGVERGQCSTDERRAQMHLVQEVRDRRRLRPRPRGGRRGHGDRDQLGDDEGGATGPGADQAKAAALKIYPGGHANSVERDSENGATWEVEVDEGRRQHRRRPLDQNYQLVVAEADSEAPGHRQLDE